MKLTMIVREEEFALYRQKFDSQDPVEILGKLYIIMGYNLLMCCPDFADIELTLHEYIKKETNMEKKLVPHKWAKEIKAWADGETIQWRSLGGEWIPLNSPEWNDVAVYRVKPTPVPVYPDASKLGCCNVPFAEAVLYNFVCSGMLKEYVERFGVDGLKGQ